MPESPSAPSAFTYAQDHFLIYLKETALFTWSQIEKHFATRYAFRSKGALQVRYSRRLRNRDKANFPTPKADPGLEHEISGVESIRAHATNQDSTTTSTSKNSASTINPDERNSDMGKKMLSLKYRRVGDTAPNSGTQPEKTETVSKNVKQNTARKPIAPVANQALKRKYPADEINKEIVRDSRGSMNDRPSLTVKLVYCSNPTANQTPRKKPRNAKTRPPQALAPPESLFNSTNNLGEIRNPSSSRWVSFKRDSPIWNMMLERPDCPPQITRLPPWRVIQYNPYSNSFRIRTLRPGEWNTQLNYDDNETSTATGSSDGVTGIQSLGYTWSVFIDYASKQSTVGTTLPLDHTTEAQVDDSSTSNTSNTSRLSSEAEAGQTEYLGGN